MTEPEDKEPQFRDSGDRHLEDKAPEWFKKLQKQQQDEADERLGVQDD